MSSEIRTALVGVGVVAVCLAMASLKGHHLLMAFAAASLAGSIWTWMQKHSRKPMSEEQQEAPAQAACPPSRIRTGETQRLRTSETQRLRTSETQRLRTSETQRLRTSEMQRMRNSASQEEQGKVYSFPAQQPAYSDVRSS